MKSIIFLAFLAIANAYPLDSWGGYHQTDSWGHNYHGDVANQVAHQITEHSIHDQIAHTNEAIQNLQWKLQQLPQVWNVHTYPQHFNWGLHQGLDSGIHHDVGFEALHHLKQDVEYQQGKLVGGVQDDIADNLHETVKTGVEAQLSAGQVHNEGLTHGVYVPLTTGLHPQVFHITVQKLIDESNKQEIENQITHHHHWAQQLHEQQEFIAHQKHQIETQQAFAQLKGVPQQVAHLEQVHHQLQVQEYHLIKEQLAHHVAMLQLQQALVHKEEQVLQDAVAEHMQEKIVKQGSYPSWQHEWSY